MAETTELTQAELTVLGLIAERPRHGLDIEQTINDRGLRQWTALAFSSVYYVAKRLEARGLVASDPQRSPRQRRVYTVTDTGRAACARAAERAIAELSPLHAPVLIGLANSPLIADAKVREALRQRLGLVEERIAAVEHARAGAPSHDSVAAIFDYSLTMLEAERAWTLKTMTRWERR